MVLYTPHATSDGIGVRRPPPLITFLFHPWDAAGIRGVLPAMQN